MSALILLSDYKMKKKELAAKRESEAPITLAFMREFRAELMSRFSAIDARFDRMESRFDQIDAKFDQVNARIDESSARLEQASAELKTTTHQTKLLVEEQNLRNKQAYDGYTIVYGAIQDLKNRIKPQCLED